MRTQRVPAALAAPFTGPPASTEGGAGTAATSTGPVSQIANARPAARRARRSTCHRGPGVSGPKRRGAMYSCNLVRPGCVDCDQA